MTRPKLTWQPSKVGCYWNAGEFTIGTRVSIENGSVVMTYPKSGYLLTWNRDEVGLYKTLAAAQRAASRVLRGLPA